MARLLLEGKFLCSGIQLTDSFYVAHSENLLYRPGYEQFKCLGSHCNFFKVIHSAGELENNVSKNIDKRRIYFDLEEKKSLLHAAIFAIDRG